MQIAFVTLGRPLHLTIASALATVLQPHEMSIYLQQTVTNQSPSQNKDWRTKKAHALYDKEQAEALLNDPEEFSMLRGALDGVKFMHEKNKFPFDNSALNRYPAKQIGNVNDNFDIIANDKPDLMIMFGGPLLKAPFTNDKNAPFPILNIHSGAIPKYRGSNSLEWAWCEENYEYIHTSIHELTAKIDLGHIYATVESEVLSTDRYPEIMQKNTIMAAQALAHIVEHFKLNGKLPKPLKPHDKKKAKDVERARFGFEFDGQRVLQFSTRPINTPLPNPEKRLRPKTMRFSSQAVEGFILKQKQPFFIQRKSLFGNHNFSVNAYYHGVSLERPSLYQNEVTAENFLKHVEFLKSNFDPIKIEDLAAKRTTGGEYDGQYFTITFDDNCKSVLNIAYPILKSLNIPFTVYCNGKTMIDRKLIFDSKVLLLEKTGRLPQYFTQALFQQTSKSMSACEITAIQDLYHSHYGEDDFIEDYMTPEDMIAMKDLCSLGNHSHSHIPLGWLTDEDIIEEYDNSAKKLEDTTGMKVMSTAIPYGTLNSMGRHKDSFLAKYKNTVMVEAKTDTGQGNFIPRLALRNNDPEQAIIGRLIQDLHGGNINQQPIKLV